MEARANRMASTTSYLVWRDLWRGFFGIESSWAPERQRAHLEAQLAAIDAGYVQRMPLLDVVLNVAIADSELTRSFDPELRKASLRSIAARLPGPPRAADAAASGPGGLPLDRSALPRLAGLPWA